MRWMKRNRTYSVDETIRRYSDIEVPAEFSEPLEEYALKIFDYIKSNYIESVRSIRTGDLYTLNQTFMREYEDLKRLFDEYNKDSTVHDIYDEYIKSSIEKHLERLMNGISWIPLSIYFDVLWSSDKYYPVVITRVNDNFVEDLKQSSCEAIKRWKFVSYFTGEKLKCLGSYPRHVEIDDLRLFDETQTPLDEVTAWSKKKAHEAFILYTAPLSNSTLSKEFGVYVEDVIERYVFVGYNRVAGLSGVTKDRKSLTDYVVIDSSIHMMGGYEFVYSKGVPTYSIAKRRW